jgi:outer membrane protein assembly factor BamE (lipoprotein component of BamABCDE complex)
MKRKIWSVLAVLAMLLLGGCDREGRFIEEAGLEKLEAGVSRESDVYMAMGQPQAVMEEEGGAKVLHYPRGPEGARTWFFHIGSDGVLVSYEQVLTPENFARIRPGMDRDEVTRLLGKPRSVMLFPLKNEEVWDWKYIHDHNEQLFNVHIDMVSNKVTATSTSALSSELAKH